MTRLPRAVLVGLALATLSILLLIATAPAVQAQDREPGFGEIVGDLGEDAEHEIGTSGAPDEVFFRDSDGDGNLDGDEAVYLAQSSTTESGDVRLADALDGSSFTKIEAGDSDTDLDLESLSGTIRFFDLDHDGSVSSGDSVYYDLDNNQDGQISSNDLILAGTDAGEKVSSGHQYSGSSLQDVNTNPTFGFYDEDSDGNYEDAEAAVIDIDEDDWLTVGDIRLGDTDGGSGGTVVEADDSDATFDLTDFSDTWEFQYRDPDGDDQFDLNEHAYISTGDDVATFAVRIGNPPEGFDAGSQVIEQHDDWGIPTNQLDGSLAYLDDDGDGEFDDGDRLYYDLSGSDSDEVSRGDIVLTGSNAGELVSGGADDIGTSLVSYDGDLRFFDTDGNDNYGADIVYADTDNDDIVKSYDVQLSDGTDPYASGDDGEDDAEAASIEITSPEDGTEVTENTTVEIAGTADGGDADVDEVTLEATGGAHTLGNVSGTTSWNATFTPEASGDYTLTASVQPASGDEASTSVTLTVVEAEDGDDDGVADEEDNCPEVANEDQADLDGDGVGDACDEDTDGDGIADRVDECPQEAGQPANEGCPEQGPEDSDDDGVVDPEDECPDEPGTEANDGCPEETPDGNGTADDGEDQEDTPAVGPVVAIAVLAVAAAGLRRR